MMLLALLACLAAGGQEGPPGSPGSPGSTGSPGSPGRPRDPWVFRSVLEERARMITVALHPELWIAYDAESCALYAAWSGGVHFAGAVYDTVHGPQPTIAGSLLLAPEAGPGSGASVPVAWRARSEDGALLALTPRFRGYELVPGWPVDVSQAVLEEVELHWDLRLPGGSWVQVRERPRVGQIGGAAGRRLVFQRHFQVRGLPPGVELQLFSGLWTQPAGDLWAGTRCWVGGSSSPAWPLPTAAQRFLAAGPTQAAQARIEAWAAGTAPEAPWSPSFATFAADGEWNLSLTLFALAPRSGAEGALEEPR